ncbi:MAG: hypothetical protein PUI88_08665 [Prevotella sp.]|nr:hypothetical protein [Prevotella sp.]
MKITQKNRRIVFLFVALLQAVVTVANIPHRLVYGYFRSNGTTDSYGLGKFYLDDLEDISIIQPGDGEQAIFCGACADGIYYTCEYPTRLPMAPCHQAFMPTISLRE